MNFFSRRGEPDRPPAPVWPGGPIGRFLIPAVEQLDRVRAALTYDYVELGHALVGVGVGVYWEDGDFVVLSVAAGGNEHTLNLTAGVLKDVEHDRLAVLAVCNSLTRDNAAYPMFLHDAEAGWDVVVQQRYPLDVLLASPRLLADLSRALPTMAAVGRARCRQAGVVGRPYTWPADGKRLLFRSLL